MGELVEKKGFVYKLKNLGKESSEMLTSIGTLIHTNETFA